MPAPAPTKALLVGSIAVENNIEAFKLASAKLGSKLPQLPDGETGERNNWIWFQWLKLPPRIKKDMMEYGGEGPQIEPDPPLTLDEFPETTYDEAAIASYKVFCELREQGIIAKGQKFQFGLPTLTNFVKMVVWTKYCVAAEKHIETRLMAALRRIQDAIPHEDLCIQFESANEMGQMQLHRLPEQLQPTFTPYLDNPMEGFVERFKRFVSNVDADVQVGVHLCLGDYMHHHFFLPEDAGIFAQFGNALLTAVKDVHPLSWIHLPVPVERDDDAYFAPLNDLVFDGTLYLGLVREEDEEGSRRRLETARRVLDRPFGISTECGLGRVAPELVPGVLEIMDRLIS